MSTRPPPDPRVTAILHDLIKLAGMEPAWGAQAALCKRLDIRPPVLMRALSRAVEGGSAHATVAGWAGQLGGAVTSDGTRLVVLTASQAAWLLGGESAMAAPREVDPDFFERLDGAADPLGD